MTEPMTRVLHELCTEIDQAALRLAEEKRDHGYTRDKLRHEEQQHKWTSDRGDSTKRQLDAATKELADLRDQLDDQTQAATDELRHKIKLRDTVEGLRTDLYLYLVELAGHRDTASTKAERVALGHVVERLAEIRGMNDEERRAVA